MSKHTFEILRCLHRFSGQYFPTFGLYTDQRNSEYGHFSRSEFHDQNSLLAIVKYLAFVLHLFNLQLAA